VGRNGLDVHAANIACAYNRNTGIFHSIWPIASI
jgi:hypothetical protein